MTYAVINQVTLAFAGHERPLFSRRDQNGVPRSEFVSSESTPIGLVGADMFEQIMVDQVVPFEPSDVFSLYTDGLTEAANLDDKEFDWLTACVLCVPADRAR